MKQQIPSAPIYQHLKAAEDSQTAAPQNYRLQEMSRLNEYLEKEQDGRAHLYKKYHRGVNVLDGVDTALILAGMGMGIGGVGLLSTIVAVPVVFGLEIAALTCGAVRMVGKYVARCLAVKAKKHDEIRTLPKSKLNTVADHVSCALMDGRISDEEFRLIIDEVKKYGQLKAEIRSGARKAHAAVQLDEETKKLPHQAGQRRGSGKLNKKAHHFRFSVSLNCACS